MTALASGSSKTPARPKGSRLGWRIGPEPAVSIGAVEGEEPYLFQWVRSAFMMSDGRIVVADGGTDEIRVFTATGTHLVSWGGKGQGPGDFGNLYRADPWPGDSVVAWYSGNRGISFFDASGRFGHSFVLRSDLARWMRPRPLAVREDGTILSVVGEVADSLQVEIWDGEGRLHGSLGRQPNEELITARGPRGHAETVPAAYSSELVLAAWGDLVVASPNKPYEIRAFRADGTLARIVRREHVPVAPAEADRQVFLEQRKDMYRSSVDASTRQRVSEALLEEQIWPFLETFTLAEHFPAFSTIMADGAGHLWVREYDLPRKRIRCRYGPSSIRRGVCSGSSRRRRAWTSCRSARISSWGAPRTSSRWSTCRYGRWSAEMRDHQGRGARRHMKIRVPVILFMLVPAACAPRSRRRTPPRHRHPRQRRHPSRRERPPGRRIAAPVAHRTRSRSLRRSPGRRRGLHAPPRHGCHEAPGRADRRG